MFGLCFIELQQMSNKLEKLDLFKLPSIVFVQRTERWVRFSEPSSSEERTGRLSHPPAYTPMLLLPLSLLLLLTHARTDTPTQIQISSIRKKKKSALGNLGLI